MENCKINKAVKLAEEFIELVTEMKYAESKLIYGNIQYPSPLHRGAVRRRSMDLTRALTEMRKP